MQHWLEIQGGTEVDRMNYTSHVAIYEAILDRDQTLAEDTMRRHLEFAWELVRATFRLKAYSGS